MIKTARQLKDLIRNLSKKNAADAQVLMRNYMMERFLERISLSSYRDKFILKGGMLVAAMVGLDARSTMDLDATVKGANVSVEDVENMMAEIIAVPIDDGVTFQVKSISEIMDEAEYPGIRVTMTTLFDGVRTPLKIDISTGDCLLGADFNAGFAVNYDDGSACSLYRFFYFAYKVKISGSIQNIYLHAVPFDGNNGGINRNLSLLFFLAIITDGIAVCDLTHSGCNASQISHCLSQTGFTRTAMA